MHNSFYHNLEFLTLQGLVLKHFSIQMYNNLIQPVPVTRGSTVPIISNLSNKLKHFYSRFCRQTYSTGFADRHIACKNINMIKQSLIRCIMYQFDQVYYISVWSGVLCISLIRCIMYQFDQVYYVSVCFFQIENSPEQTVSIFPFFNFIF